MVRMDEASDPIYVEVKAVRWYEKVQQKGQRDFNFALFNKGYLPDDAVKLAQIKRGQCFCLVFLYPSPESDLGNWKGRLSKFVGKMENIGIQVNERSYPNEKRSKQVYIARLEISRIEKETNKTG